MKVPATALLAGLLMSGGVAFATAGIVDPCQSSWQLNNSGGQEPFIVCPRGDTDSFINQGWSITVIVIDNGGNPFQGIPPADIFVISIPSNELALCGGSASSNPDAPTNSAGMTTIANSTLVAGGCTSEIAIVVQGFVLQDPQAGCATKVASFEVRSSDVNGSFEADLADLAIFASHYPPNPYGACCDFDFNQIINLVDLSMFAFHMDQQASHSCF